uniref:polymorphic toxin-type HINT domain-containing protein n=2 Tax=Chryseobacterium lathyri TaxID=395933 RepID=UPI0016266769
EFKNSKGQTILVRKNDGTQNVDTYYLYNEYGQLVYVIPPLAVGTSAPDQTMLDKLCYQYRYDGLGRLVEKKVPGKGWEYMLYDKQDRLVAAQDANLRVKGQWLYTKYDQFGRIAITGIGTGAARTTEQSVVDGYDSNNVNRLSAALFERQGMNVYYGNQDSTYPNSTKWVTLLSLNYYDTYPGYDFNPAFPSTILGEPVITDTQNAPVNTQAMPTLSLVKNIEDDNWTKNYVYYDKKGRAVGTYSINHLGGTTRTESELDFVGMAKQTKVYHKRLGTDTEKVISQSFDYDNQNRVTKHRHQVDSGPVELLTENTYNELSQLSNKKVGGGLQSIDYQYDIRGALTKINDPAALGTKLFGYELKYFNPQNTTQGSTGKYNGNITEVTWKTATDQVLRQYNYQYDGLNRLKKGIYSEPVASVPQNGFFNETLAYDLNGNITSLQRNGKSSSGTAQLIDDLTYNYTGNKLNTVTDASGNYSGYPDTSGTIISYDDNGNMKDHKDKGVLQIDYNFLNLPDYIKFDKGLSTRTGMINENTSYTYRADGTKLKKIYNYTPPIVDPLGTTTTLSTKITEYVDGFQYETPAGKKGGTNLILKFVPTAEGYYNFENNKYIYSYTDHLGNVRLSYSKNLSGSAEVLEENNYYAFGLKHEGYNALAGNPAYSYGYSGKELQKETGWGDYGARMYMSDIGRWGVIDPLAEQMRRYSPYNFAFNNPVSFIDPDGMAPRQFAMAGDGFGNVDVSSGATNPNWLGLGVGGNPYYDYLGTLGSQPFGDDGSGNGSNNEDIGISLPNNDGLHFNVPEVFINASGNRSTWNKEFLEMNQYLMISKLTGALMEANYDANSTNLGWGIAHSKASREVAAVENFLFLELPGSFVGGEFLSAGWRAANLTKYLCGPMGRLTNGLIKICFTEGTLVATEKGNKKIEDIKEGDLVWSYNEETAQKELKKVVALSRNTSSSLVKISVNGTEITCTPEHPFYVNGSWMEAKHLTKGMLLTTLDGKTSPIESIKFLDEKVKVYNFEVEGNHNYYVSEKGILVHNNCEYTTEFIKGFYVRGITTMENGVYNRTVQGLANYEGKSLFELVKAFESQAVNAGMDKVVIKGVDIVETRLMNPRAAEIMGYSYKELSKNSIELVKFLK